MEEADAEEIAAQVVAEKVLHAPWNSDKQLALASPKSLALEPNFSTIAKTISNLSGFELELNEKNLSLNDRLSELNAQVSDTEIRITLLGSVLFAFDRFDLRPDAIATLEKVHGLLTSFKKNLIRIEGHTDSIGSNSYNQTLSRMRARSVGDWFEAQGVSKNRLTIEGFGEDFPVESNDTLEGRQRNRRVEIVIEK